MSNGNSLPGGINYGYPQNQEPNAYRTWWNDPVTGIGGHESTFSNGDWIRHHVHQPNGAAPHGWEYNRLSGQSHKF